MKKSTTNSKIFLYAAWAILIIVSLKDSLTGYPFNTSIAIRYAEDLLVALLYAWMIVDILKRKETDSVSALFLMVSMFFFLFHAAQTFFTKDILASIKFIFFIRDNFWYFPVFYFSIKYLKAESLIKILLFFLYVQVFFIATQILYHAAKYGEILWEDNINGSLGMHSSHILSYCLILLLPITIDKNKKVLTATIIVVLLLASARSLILFSVVVFPLLYLAARFSVKKAIIASSLMFLLVVPLFNYINDTSSATLDPLTLFAQQKSELNEGVGAARLSFLIYSVQKVDTLEKALLGYGPASYSSRSASVLSGSEYITFKNEFRYYNEFMSGGSSYNAWIVENGYIVFFALLVVFLYPVYLLRKNWYASAAFLTVFLGLSVQKLMESYSVALIYCLVLAYFVIKENEKKSRHEKSEYSPRHLVVTKNA